METDTEKRLMDSVQGLGGGKAGMDGESNIETYITIFKIDSQWEFATQLRELNPGLYDNLEVWDGVGSGGEVQEG